MTDKSSHVVSRSAPRQPPQFPGRFGDGRRGAALGPLAFSGKRGRRRLS